MDTARLEHLVRQLDLTTRVTVDSIDEALLLARELKTRGAHDLFRGQCNARWGVSPSLFRVPDDAKEEVQNRLSRLQAFLKETDGFSYSMDDNTVGAIAQHYGVPTSLVDFTSNPDVAAFFAWDMNGKLPEPGQMACIFALNVSDFTECWADGGYGRASVKSDTYPEIVTIDVSNLWRLRNQDGCFVWMPFEVERIYHFDRIVFPYGEPTVGTKTREHIYPTNQSPLEQLLNQYFMNEQGIAGERQIRQAAGARLKTLIVEPDTLPQFESRADHESWHDIERWLAVPEESPEDALPGFLLPSVFGTLPFEDWVSQILGQLDMQAIEMNRARGLDLESFANIPNGTKERAYLECLKRLWNGMRVLPYSVEQLRRSIEELSRLFSGGFWDEYKASFGNSHPYPSSHEVEFGSHSGGYARGFLRESTLRNILTPEFELVLNTSEPMLLAEKPFRCLPKAESVRFKLDFHALTEAFVAELIPTQLAMRIVGDQEWELRIATFYSPARLDSFGIP